MNVEVYLGTRFATFDRRLGMVYAIEGAKGPAPLYWTEVNGLREKFERSEIIPLSDTDMMGEPIDTEPELRETLERQLALSRARIETETAHKDKIEKILRLLEGPQ